MAAGKNIAEALGLELYRLVTGGSSSDDEKALELIGRGASLRVKETPLLIPAAYHGRNGIVRAVLDKGVSVDERDFVGNTALIETAGTLHVGTIGLLLEQGADVNARNSVGFTPLMAAIKPVAYMKTIPVLLDAGADVLAKNVYGDSAFDLAKKEFFAGHPLMVMLRRKKEEQEAAYKTWLAKGRPVSQDVQLLKSPPFKPRRGPR